MPQDANALGAFESFAERTRQSVKPAGGRQEGVLTKASVFPGRYVAHVAENILSIPERAVTASENRLLGMGLDVAPAVEAGMGLMGLGATGNIVRALRSGFAKPAGEVMSSLGSYSGEGPKVLPLDAGAPVPVGPIYSAIGDLKKYMQAKAAKADPLALDNIKAHLEKSISKDANADPLASYLATHAKTPAEAQKAAKAYDEFLMSDKGESWLQGLEGKMRDMKEEPSKTLGKLFPNNTDLYGTTAGWADKTPQAAAEHLSKNGLDFYGGAKELEGFFGKDAWGLIAPHVKENMLAKTSPVAASKKLGELFPDQAVQFGPSWANQTPQQAATEMLKWAPKLGSKLVQTMEQHFGPDVMQAVKPYLTGVEEQLPSFMKPKYNAAEHRPAPWQSPEAIEARAAVPKAIQQYRREVSPYTVDTYHGTSEFAPDGNVPAIRADKAADEGFFSTKSPDLAELYSGWRAGNAQIMPMRVDPTGYHKIDAGGRRWDSSYVSSEAAAARLDGKPGIIIENVLDEPHSGSPNYREELPPQTVYISFKPETVRSKFAAFDPAKYGENNLLASVAGGGLVGTGAAAAAKYRSREDY